MKAHDEGYFHANVKRKTTNRKGDSNSAPKVIDTAKNPWNPDIGIGNGTVAHIKLFTFDYNVQGRKGTSAILTAVQIIDHVEYNGEGVDFDDESGAF